MATSLPIPEKLYPDNREASGQRLMGQSDLSPVAWRRTVVLGLNGEAPPKQGLKFHGAFSRSLT